VPSGEECLCGITRVALFYVNPPCFSRFACYSSRDVGFIPTFFRLGYQLLRNEPIALA
jgi:hypothetical protein